MNPTQKFQRILSSALVALSLGIALPGGAKAEDLGSPKPAEQARAAKAATTTSHGESAAANPGPGNVRQDTTLLAQKPAPAPDPVPRSSWSFKEAALIPVQGGGRMKPLDSFARELMLFETGSRTYKGWNPVDLLLSWIAFPQSWQGQRFIQVARGDVRRQIVLDEKRDKGLYSPQELYGNFALLQYAQHMDQASQGGPEAMSGKSDRGNKGSPQDQELKHVLERISLFRDVVSGHAFSVVPVANDGAWLNLSGNEFEGNLVRARFVDLLRAYQGTDEAQFDHASRQLRETIEHMVPNFEEKQSKAISAEVFYNRARPFLIAWILYLTAALTWLFVKRPEKKPGETKVSAPKGGVATVAKALTICAVAAHIVGIAIRCYIAGRPPVTNMYESIIWVSLGVVGFATILYWIQKQPITLLVASVLATVGLIAADAAPAMIDPGLHPLVPVLRSNYWLTIHVLTITLGYAAFALSLGLANVTLFHFWQQARARSRGDSTAMTATQLKIASTNLLTYRAIQFGVVLVAGGTILGGIWADYSWGRFWGWDPKEVWALICVLCYVAILHGRYAGWVGIFAFPAWTVVGFLSVLMAWYGVNFVLGVGLHSYGFSSAGGQVWIAGFVLLQVGYVLATALVHGKLERARKNLSAKAAVPVVP